MPDQTPNDNPLNPFVGSLWDCRELILMRLRSTADALTDLAKIWAIISVVVSTIFIGAYLSQFDMPFLSVDNILPIVAQIFASMFVFFYVIVIIYVFLPLSIKYIISANVQSALPALFPQPSTETRTLKFFSFLKEYASFYFPSICLNIWMITLLILPAVKIDARIGKVLPLCPVALGGIFVYILASRNSVAPRDRSDVVFWYLGSTISTAAWFIIVIQLLSGIANRTMGGKLSNLESYFIAALVLIAANLIHLACGMTGFDKAKRLLIVLSTVGALMCCMWIGVSSVGGFILRFAKLGGNSPITYKVENGPALKGCLV